MQFFSHPSSDVQSDSIGSDTRIWQYVVILPDAVIGESCNVCSHCLIENDVIIGDRTTIKSGVQIWDGVRLGSDVFIGPNVTFTNDLFPRSKQRPEKFVQTKVENGASVGAGAVLLAGVTVGSSAMIGAGSVVTKSVPDNAIAVGNPARIVGYVGTAEATNETSFSNVTNSARVMPASVKDVTYHQFPKIVDARGNLTVGEFQRDIPFEVMRYFVVFDVPSSEIRGEHAHKECHQFLVCLHGSCAVVADDGVNRQEFNLTRPEEGVYLPPLTWGVQYKYSADAVLLVFASHHYDDADYIRDYQEFLKIVNVSS